MDLASNTEYASILSQAVWHDPVVWMCVCVYVCVCVCVHLHYVYLVTFFAHSPVLSCAFQTGLLGVCTAE